MAELKIYGHSDDLVEIEGVIQEELDVWGALNRPLYYEIVDENGQGCKVSVKYNGKWKLDVFPLDGSDVLGLVDWDVRLEDAHLYSQMIHIYNCPENIKIRQVGEWIHAEQKKEAEVNG